MFLSQNSPAPQFAPHPQKRQIPSRLVPTAEDDLHCATKKQRLRRHIAFPSARFWDNLSEIPLTQNALRELNERNAKASYSSGHLEKPQVPRSTFRQPTVLQRFARHGGPDLRDLRGYRIPARLQEDMSPGASSLGRRKRGSKSPTKKDSGSQVKSSATQSSGPYDRAFQQHLVDHKILHNRYEYPGGRRPPKPENMDEIAFALGQDRASLSPSKFTNDDFERFQSADEYAFKERDVTANVIPIIEGGAGYSSCAAGQIPFTNLEPLTDGTIAPGNPDLYYGARPEQVDLSIRREIGHQIIPSTQLDLPIVPNFFLHVKGPDGSMAVASRQASYDGALGARAINSLQSFGQPEPRYDNNAYTLTSVYHGGQLKMYTSHPISPSAPGASPEYVTTHIDSWALTGNADTFRRGVAAYRNGRDWAEQKRDNAIKQAQEHVAQQTVVPLSRGSTVSLDETIAETLAKSPSTTLNPDANLQSPYESDTSADELSEEPRKSKRPRSHSPRKRQ